MKNHGSSIKYIGNYRAARAAARLAQLGSLSCAIYYGATGEIDKCGLYLGAFAVGKIMDLFSSKKIRKIESQIAQMGNPDDKNLDIT
jgi:hypothetical protein